MEVGSIITALIPAVTPMLVWGIKLLVPKIPKMWLPIIAPVLGALIAVIQHLGTLSWENVVVGAVLGLAGTGIREMWDQVNKAAAPAAPVQ